MSGDVIVPDREELRLRRIWASIDLTDTEALARKHADALAENERLREALANNCDDYAELSRHHNQFCTCLEIY